MIKDEPLFYGLFQDELTFLTGRLEKPPSTRNGRGSFREGSHTTPKRSPPNGS